MKDNVIYNPQLFNSLANVILGNKTKKNEAQKKSV